MADYRDKLDEWRDAARQKARELDDKYQIRERVGEGARAAGDAARKGADAVKGGAERARAEAERLGEDYDLNEHAQDVRERTQGARDQAARAAEEASRVAREVGGRMREAGQKASERAGDVLGGAKKYYKNAARAADIGVRATRLTTASSVGLFRAYDWARQNPKQAIVITLSLAAGERDRKSTRLNSSHANISYAVFCLKKKKQRTRRHVLNSTVFARFAASPVTHVMRRWAADATYGLRAGPPDSRPGGGWIATQARGPL